MSDHTVRRSVVLRRRPSGAPDRSDFDIIEDAIPVPGAHEVLTRTIWLSVDPYMRGRLREQQTYAKAIEIGEVMTGETVGDVVAYGDPAFAPRRHRRPRPRLADTSPQQGGTIDEGGSARR